MNQPPSQMQLATLSVGKRALEGLSVKEISDILGRNENTVKTHLARGSEKLRKYLED